MQVLLVLGGWTAAQLCCW